MDDFRANLDRLFRIAESCDDDALADACEVAVWTYVGADADKVWDLMDAVIDNDRAEAARVLEVEND